MKMHVGINVIDLDKSIEFYTKVFNPKPVKVKLDTLCFGRFTVKRKRTSFLNVQE
ncbi:VOC family protein [Neobacillus ginsengisoli]|uniref:Catechol 2,3-dioxygenase-like lactoylglutathione lyase family enzyme n=1 Tax=Neobacillus ginsengisoli TaxID=904295 RepID=A0ABT9XV13_9BACI|nr:VOC family protein [Neobacillus ginsengisoli]MDQ0199213.1 catechol 2,3-dioxygenase-like lactoylglutathione lyase family enzyme [Neobacillus ginsengisoli]